MKRVIVCAGLMLVFAGTVFAEETKKKPVSASIEQLCGDKSAASSNRLDCKTTGAVAVSDEPAQAGAKKSVEPRLGFSGSPWIISGF